MAITCTAESLWNTADCFGCLSNKQLMAICVLVKCNLLNGITTACTPEALLAAAIAAGYLNLSEKQLLAAMAYLDCQISQTL